MNSLPTEQEVFQCLCKEYGSSAGFSEIAERTELFPHGPKSAETWFRKTPKGSILVTEDKEGKIRKVDAFSKHARLCLDYSYNGKCDRHDCTYLHICRDYMTNSCRWGVSCQLNHRFLNHRDRALLSRVNFDQFTDLQLQMLVLSSTPQICVRYNTDGKCERGDSCSKIHICHGYLRKCCNSDKCRLLHESAMDTEHTKAILKRLMLSDVNKHEVMKMIFDNELSLLSDSGGNTILNNDWDVDRPKVMQEMIVDDEPSLSGNATTECHTHQDNPDAPICSQFLIGRCDKSSACTELHCFLPYHWQYKVSLFDEWKCFIDKDNLALEKMYCDVNVETVANFKPAQPLDLSRLQRQGRFLVDEEYEITLDLDNMTIAFQRPKGGDRFLAGLLRRLFAVPYVSWPYKSMFTIWKWYWKNGNVWHTYDKDVSGNNLQQQIEQAYQEMLGQGETKATYQFLISENIYNLFLDSTREMYQVNVRSGTKRQVKRRPEKPISDDDLNEWACGDSISKRKERLVKTYIPSHVPSHWSRMPLNVQCTRVALDATSAEFQEVEKLFKKSMHHPVVIKNIDRVQNPLIWEQYCRSKEKMTRKAQLLNQEQVQEKKLFHGTRPENVDAICKDNFDTQISKNTRTPVLGQGTSFAVNASLSHYYATRDPNLFQYMFLAKVLVGSYTVRPWSGLHGYQTSPLEDCSNVDTRLYDAYVDNTSHPCIFVVFDRNHLYPEYVIQYSVPQPPMFTSVLIPSSYTQNIFSASAVSSSIRFASLSCYAALAEANSSYCGSSQLRPTTPEMPMAPRIEHGILKHWSCSSNFLGKASLPSGCTTQSSNSASAVSNAELTGIARKRSSDNLGTASLASGSTKKSCHTASTVCNAELTGTTPTRSSDSLDSTSLASGSTTQSCHTASTVCNADLTGTTPTRSLDSLDSTSLPSGSVTESNYSASTVSNAESTGIAPTRSSDNLDTASLPSGSTTENCHPASTVSNAEPTGTVQTRSSENLNSASLPSDSATESCYSSSTMFNAELTGTPPTRSSDNLDTASLPSGSATESCYSASTMFNAELTGTVQTRSSENLNSASLPSGSVTESNYSASTVSNAELTGTPPTRSSDNLDSTS